MNLWKLIRFVPKGTLSVLECVCVCVLVCVCVQSAAEPSDAAVHGYDRLLTFLEMCGQWKSLYSNEGLCHSRS